MITTVGPYLLYGGLLVAACADAGTDYVDLTGEPEFVDQMYLEHHDRAVATGARIVHACGFDSIPHDLGARYTVLQLPEGQPVTVRGVVRAGGPVLRRHVPLGDDRVLPRAPDAEHDAGPAQEGGPSPWWPHGRGRSRASRTATASSATGCCRCPPSTRSWSRGPPPRSSATARTSATPTTPGSRRLPYVAGTAVGATAMMVGAQVPPVRKVLMSRVKAGDGPSESRRARSWFTVDFVGQAGGTTVHTRVSGGDPGYTETAKMLAESALCLAFDDNPPTSGQVTTAVAMGEHLTRRLVDAGIRFDVR